MLKFHIDSINKTIECEIMLAGEKEPIAVKVLEYDLKTTEAGTFFVIRRAAASRAWMTLMLEDFVRDKEFPIPEKFARTIKLIA